MLREDYAPQFDERAMRLFEVICSHSKRMSHLIDDLLEFSRLSRTDCAHEPVDMTALVRSIIHDLTLPDPRRQMQITLRDLPVARGDAAMLRQVFANLISNALKFTRSAAVPVIEIGGHEEGSEAIYFVRDNGVGFDMKYSHKLFKVFQRLHKPEEFEGTGVGLAIIQRVVNRHGGRVWAESAVNAGACFFVALPADTYRHAVNRQAGVAPQPVRAF
jgi:two-component system sensor kinase